MVGRRRLQKKKIFFVEIYVLKGRYEYLLPNENKNFGQSREYLNLVSRR